MLKFVQSLAVLIKKYLTLAHKLIITDLALIFS